MRFRMYPKFLIVLLTIAVLPIIVFAFFTFRTTTATVKDEIEKQLVFRATEIAGQVSIILENAVDDLMVLKGLPKDEKAYWEFSEAKKSMVWTRAGSNQAPRELNVEVPLYREIAYIGADGMERIKIQNSLNGSSLAEGRYEIASRIVPRAELSDVSDPNMTPYRVGGYFNAAARLPADQVYISHLTGFFVGAEDQLKGEKYPEDAVDGKRYDGVIYFASPQYDEGGKLEGVIMLALDQAHLQEMIIHTDPLQEERLVFAPYATGNYAFLFDDEGWVIAHAKLWDIRGVDANGVEMEPFKNLDDTNSGPVNLIRGPQNEAHFKLVSLMEDIWNRRSGVFDVANIGVEKGGAVIRAQAYAPIRFSAGDYGKYGVFGGVMVGARTSSVNLVISSLMKNLYMVFAVIAVFVMIAATIVARSITRPIKKLSRAAESIASGKLDRQVPPLGADEIGDLGESFNKMAVSLTAKIAEIERSKEREVELQRRLAEKEKREKAHLKSRIDRLEEELAQKPFEGMVFESRQMKDLMGKVTELATTDATVLIAGERGTGKEMVAASLHSLSGRKDGPYLRVNCAAIPETLIESELFGHAKGSFSGAGRDRQGFFEAASGGTLLLDEIGDLSKTVQAKLLRVLQDKGVIRLGETRERKVDVRLVAASNRDLAALVRAGAFRADLYDRLNVLQVHVPPLRERREDIVPLARYFLQRAAAKHDRNIIGISEEAVDAMMGYSWPGNVRELENAIERAVIQAGENLIEKEDLVLSQDLDSPLADANLPDMTIDAMKLHYAKYIRNKYPARPLKDIKSILDVDWNTLRKYLGN